MMTNIWDTSQTHELMEIDQSANEEMSQSKSNSYISELATTSLDRSNDSSYPELAFNRVPQPSTLDQTELDESFNGGLPTLSSNQSFQPASIVPDFEDTPYQQVDKPLQSSLAQITTSCDTLPFVSRSPAISSSLFGTTATSPLTANHSESNTFFFPRAILSSPAEDNHEFDLNASEETNEFAVRLSSPVFGACSGQTTIERQSARMKNVKPPNEDVDDHEEQTNQNDFASRPETPQARLAVNQQNSQWEYEFGENESHTPLLNTVVDIHTDLTASRDVSYSDFAVSPSPRKSKCEFKERRLTKSPVNDLSTQELNSNDKNVVGEEANDELETEIESASQQPETKLKQKKKGKKSKSDKKLGKDNDETIAQDIVEKQKKKRKKMADKETDKGSQGLFGANNLAEMPFLEPKGRKKKTTTQQEEIPDENPINTIVMPLKKTKNLEITEANNKSGYKPFNRNQIPLIIRNYLTSHQWKKSAKMIMILTQDSRLYGDILLKTGLLIFDKKLHHRVDQRDEIIFELEQFNRLIQNIAGEKLKLTNFESNHLN